MPTFMFSFTFYSSLNYLSVRIVTTDYEKYIKLKYSLIKNIINKSNNKLKYIIIIVLCK